MFRKPRGQMWMGWMALVAAGAALFPGVSSSVAPGAALLAVGGLALLAGHAWAQMVAAPAHVALAGRAAIGAPTATLAIVAVTALPAALVCGALLSRAILRFVESRRATPAQAR
ncbi:MAG TPA: hypothetical protein VKE22_22685 [Haliangiales bacterium]|nr:hypothetical protein [Haliangiales bacterium]